MGKVGTSHKKQDGLGNRLELVENVFLLKQAPKLKNISLIGAQHILPSTLTMLTSFFDRGLLPENVYLIGKCYSTDLYTYHQLKELGVYVCPSSLQFQKNQPFDLCYKENVKAFVKKFLRFRKNSAKKLICIDDGGELISHLNLISKRHGLTLVGLEQTTSGYQKIEQLNLNMGIINVARSFAKIKVESKIVVKTAIQAMYNKIIENSLCSKNTLIFGNGAIGGAMADALEQNSNVFLADIDCKKSTGTYEDYLRNLSDFDLIIGCVGKTVLPLNKLRELKEGSILISLSSSDREFDIVEPRSACKKVLSCHDDFKCANGATVLNCGFPVNFSGDATKVDIEEFELTRALLTLGILQACEVGLEKGILSLDKEIQSRLVEQFSSKYNSQTNDAPVSVKSGFG